MQNFTLKLLFQIVGVGAASGLLLKDNLLYLISDSSSFLYSYNIEKDLVDKIQLIENSRENMLKKDKLDLEAISLKDNKLFIFGSGSTKKREVRFTYDLQNKKVQEKDFSEVYKKIRNATLISECDLNIEGVIFANEKWYFFQRGNGSNAKNGIIILDKKTDKVNFIIIQLPKIKTVEATFTDAIVVRKNIYFLAAAENTNSTYEDGEVMGSLVGKINLDTLQLMETQQISENKKFEGITLYKETSETISFLLCEDDDTEILVSDIFELKLQK